ncbi:hypothetical protein C8J56DRAFT_977616 [Mycena floridula]|nr:hypothetical protein C8J56DRAFT_977616 [Mycena floridula]
MFLFTQRQSGIDLEKSRPKLMEISYESPNLVKSQITAWVATAQSVAVVTTLMVGTSSQLLGVIKSDDTLANIKGARINLLIFSSYAAIISNVMATIACLFLMDRLGDIDLNQAHKGQNTIREGQTEPVGSLKLLLDYGGDRAIGRIMYQCIGYFLSGMLFMFLQLLTYMWLGQGPIMSGIITALTVLAISTLWYSYWHQ